MKKFPFFVVLAAVWMSVAVQAQTFMTCAEAQIAAMSVSANNELYADGALFKVEGYVTGIAYSWSASAKNMSFWMADTEDGGNVIQAYKCSIPNKEDVPNVGDKVQVIGQLTKYGKTPEIAAGCTCTILSSGIPPVNLGAKTIAEFLSLKNSKDTCVLKGTVANIVMDKENETQYNPFGNFDLVEIGNPEVKVFVYGLLTAGKQSKKFIEMGIDEGDTVTVKAIYSDHNGTPQAVNAIYISHTKVNSETPPAPAGIDFATAFADGWDAWIGQTVTFSNDFYYCDSYQNTIAYRRLRTPEEAGEEGTDAYKEAAARNTHDSCYYDAFISSAEYRPGTIIRGLKAYIPAANRLEPVNEPELINNALPTELPDLGTTNLVVCATNIENFFVDNLGPEPTYHGADNAEELEVQKKKLGAALSHMNADIYALAEVEQGTNAVQTLVDLLNEKAGSDQYTYLISNTVSPFNSAMVCYIYRKTVVEPYGDYLQPYVTYAGMNWREAIQCFKHKATGEKFNLSMNHFWAKITKTDEDRMENMQRLISKLPSALYYDPDVLVMGDLNSYTGEEVCQLLTRDRGYVDLLMKYAPNGYSHVFDGLVGYLDHAYATPSMAKQVTKAVPYHLNADTRKNAYSYTAGDESMYRYSDHEPILVGLRLGDSSAGEEGFETVQMPENRAQKIIRHGQLVIIRSGVEYTVTGQRL